MDLVTIGITAAVGKLSEQVIRASYTALKGMIVKKFGKSSEIVDAIDKLEKNPNSIGRRETLKEEISDSQANQDEDIKKAAEILIEKIKGEPDGQQIINHIQQSVSGNQNIFSGTGNVQVHLDQTKD